MNVMTNEAVIRMEEGAEGTYLLIDPASRLEDILAFPEIPDLLGDSLKRWTTWHERMTLSIREALSTPAKAAPFVAALLACGARVGLEEGTVEVEDFLGRSGRSRLDVYSIQLPVRSEREAGMAAVCPTPTDAPIVAAFACVTYDGDIVKSARLALTGVWRKAVQLADAAEKLAGTSLSDDVIHAVAEAVEDEVKPRGNFIGSAGYRRSMAGVTTRRALAECKKGVKRS